METVIEYAIRILIYCSLCFFLEVNFTGSGFVDLVHGIKVKTRVGRRYREGYISLYMIAVYALSLPFIFEPIHTLIDHWFILFRFLTWAVLITSIEWISGFLFDKILKFYPWDYYADSKFKVGKRGYTAWTLIPLWGVAGMGLEYVHTGLDIAIPAILNAM